MTDEHTPEGRIVLMTHCHNKGWAVRLKPNAPAHAGAVATSVKPVVGNSGISRKSLNILAADDYEEYGDDPM